MKQLVLLLGMVLVGCAGSKPPAMTGNYGGVLPMYREQVVYHSAVARPGVTSAIADERAKAWITSAGRVLSMQKQNPIRLKADLVYVASLPARRVPGDDGDLTTLPPLQFFVTVDNRGDSSRVWVTNFEVADRRGNWQMLEKQKQNTKEDKQWTTLWLADVDAAVTQMIDSLSQYLTQP